MNQEQVQSLEMESVMGKNAEHEKNPHFEEARQHMKAAHEAIHKTYESMFPTGFIENRRKARKEFLLAMRSMLDAAIEHVDKTIKSG
jgi:hypothetical protein